MRQARLSAVIGSLALGLAASLASAQVAPRAALEKDLPEIKMDGVALVDVIEFLRDASGANLNVNWRALEQNGVSKDTPVSIRLRNVSLRRVLSLLLDQAGSGLLTFYSEDNVIEVTTREIADSKMITRIYPVADLLMDIPDFEGPSLSLGNNNNNGGNGGGNGNNGGGGGSGGIFNTQNSNKDEEKGKTREERAQDLVDLITTILFPNVWQVNGGKASIRFFNGNLIVTAPASVHEALGGPLE